MGALLFEDEKNKMRKMFLLVLMLFITVCLYSSSRGWGITLGGGTAEAYGCKDQADEYEISIKNYPVFRAGLFTNLPVTKDFLIKQEVLYSEKGSNQDMRHITEPVEFNIRYELSYLEIPFLFCPRLSRIGAVDIWGTAGFSFSWLLNAKYNLDGSVKVGDEIFELNDSYNMDDLDEFDYSFLYGIAAEFDFFKKAIWLEYRFSISWYKINFPTYEGEEPVQLSNQVHSLSISTKI